MDSTSGNRKRDKDDNCEKIQKPNLSRQASTTSQKDQFEHFGLCMAKKLREMQQEQRIFAEKIISEIIFYGQLGQLTMRTAQSFEALLCKEQSPVLEHERSLRFNPSNTERPPSQNSRRQVCQETRHQRRPSQTDYFEEQPTYSVRDPRRCSPQSSRFSQRKEQEEQLRRNEREQPPRMVETNIDEGCAVITVQICQSCEDNVCTGPACTRGLSSSSQVRCDCKRSQDQRSQSSNSRSKSRNKSPKRK